MREDRTDDVRRRQLDYCRAVLDQMAGEQLREALDSVGEGGRVVVTRLHDEWIFTVEEAK